MSETDDNPRKKRPLDSVLLEQYIAMVRVLGGLLVNARSALLSVAKEKGVSLESLGVSPETFIDVGEEIPALVRANVTTPAGAVVHRTNNRPPPPTQKPRTQVRLPPSPTNEETSTTAPPSELSRAEYRMLLAAAQRPGSDEEQLAMLAGYSTTSGGVAGALASLRRSGFMVDCDATEEGLRVLGPFPKLPKGERLRTYWIQWLDKHYGPCASRMFALACERHPAALTQEEAAEELGYSPTSGGVANAAAVIRKLEFIAPAGKMVVNPMFFEKKRKGRAAA